jgi:hypothetical protein
MSKEKEFIDQMNYCKNRVMCHLEYIVKEYFPLNGVPESVVESLKSLNSQTEILLDQIDITIDLIKYELEKKEKNER